MTASNAMRSARLITALRLRRLANQFGASPSGGRTGTARKRPAGSKLLLLVGLPGLAFHILITGLAARQMGVILGHDQMLQTKGLALILTLIFIAVLLANLGSRETSRSNWELEWLVTLPIPPLVLVGARLLERTAINPFGFFAFAPVLFVWLFQEGGGFASLPVAAGLTFALLAILAVIRTAIDTGLRLSVRPSTLGNIQALASIVAVLVLLPVSAIAFRPDRFFVYDWIAWIRDGLLFLPTGLVAQLVISAPPVGIVHGLLLLEILISVAAGVALLRWQMRGGVVASGIRDATRHLLATDLATPSEQSWGSRFGLAPIQRRELMILRRDRNFMVQALILPPVLTGAMYLVNGRQFPTLEANPAAWAALAFWTGVLVLSASTVKTIATEGAALWMLYTVPERLESLLRKKTHVWAQIALAYVLVALLIPAVAQGTASVAYVAYGIVALAGVLLYAYIGTALAVLGSDPFASDPRKQNRASYTGLFFLLSGMYTLLMYANDFAQRASMVVVVTSLAVTLWQRAVDHLPYMVDPAARPPPRITAADGLMGVLVLIAFNGAGQLILNVDGSPVDGVLAAGVSAVAAAAACITLYFVLYRFRKLAAPALIGGGALAAASWGLAAGLTGVLSTAAYRWVASGSASVPALAPIKPGPGSLAMLVPLALIAAVSAEFVFRGLLFSGLRRTYGVAIAIAASSAVFAVIQPPPAMPAAFVMGALAALAYERSKLLIAPMVAAATYSVLQLYWGLITS